MGRRSLRLVKPGDSIESSVAGKASRLKSEPVKEKKKKKKHKKNKENRSKNESSKSDLFQRKRDDGSTSLAILTPGDGVIPGTEKDRPVTLGMLLDRVKSGTSSLASFREDRRNLAKPMYPIYYGGYSSHGPTHDSTFANLTVAESVMVGPYFDFRSQENEEVIRKVCDNDYTATFVDHLLDLFNGKEVTDIVSNNKNEKKAVEKSTTEEIDFDFLKTLENDGIDMSFMSTLQAAYELRQEQEMKDLTVEEQLELTAHLIESLASAQSSRLSAPPPAVLSQIPGPGKKEHRLAERVITNLTNLSAQVCPGDIIDMNQVRKAMGIATTSATDTTSTCEEVVDVVDQEAPPETNPEEETNATEVVTDVVAEAMDCV